MKKLYRILLLIIVLIFLSTYNPSEFNLILQKNNTFLKIQKIEIVNNFLIKDSEIKEKLSKIYNKNIFLIKRKDIEDPLKEISFLEKIEVIKNRLGEKVKHVTFHRAQYGNPAMSPSHMRILLERYIGPVSAVVKKLEIEDPSKYGVLVVNEDKLVEIIEKPQTYLVQ